MTGVDSLAPLNTCSSQVVRALLSEDLASLLAQDDK